MHPKDAEGIANSVDPDQTAPRSSLILVCTVCPDLSVRKLRNITVLQVQYQMQRFIVALAQITFHFVSNQPHQRKRKFFHDDPPGVLSFKRSFRCQFTHWRPAHLSNGPYSITEQLRHWPIKGIDLHQILYHQLSNLIDCLFPVSADNYGQLHTG